ncbi:MAG: substrate-binding domain-containing protein, partial [Verrucomicrobiales bacterium]
GYESLRIKLEQLDEIESGNLRVGVNPVIAHVYLSEVGARFLRDYPEVRISTSVRDASGLIDLMREGELDLMIGFERLFSLQKDLEITRLFEAAVPWWVRKGHPLLRKRKMAMGDFADYPIISQHLPPLYMERFVDLCLSAERDREVGSVSNAHLVDDYSVLCRMAVQSDAILLCPELHARAGSMADRLRRLEAPIEMPPATISAAWPTHPTPSPLATRFLGILQEEIEAVLGETGG